MAKKHTFETEVSQLLDLMINSLYSNKEIFLRELISNASDALDKLSYLNVSDEKYKQINFSPRIDISFNQARGMITIADNGIGMDEKELQEHLGIIAKSGTKSFLENLSGDKKKDSGLIGQFGVGFYSSFMVASRVVVESKKPLESKAFAWTSDGKGEYEIGECIKDEFGTQITIYLKEEDKHFASRWELESIIQKYSEHIAFPIFLHYEESVSEPSAESSKDSKDKGKDSKKETKVVEKVEKINSAKALWTIQKNELKKKDYIDFYKSFAHESEEPLSYIHTNAEGALEYNTLFFIPKVAPFDMYRVDYKSGVKLYVKRVFISDNDKELLPPYLRFIRGVIDSSDLPLNVSREILQQNKILANIKSASTKKILGEIQNLAKKEKTYKEFYKQYGRVLKEGLYGDFENKDRLLELLRFDSTKGEFRSLEQYIKDMKPEQKNIYYALGSSISGLKDSPILEKFKAKDYEVMLFGDEVDGVVIPSIGQYKDKNMVSIFAKDNGLEEESISEEQKKEYEKVMKIFTDTLGERIESVNLSTMLGQWAIGLAKEDENPMLAQMFAQMGQSMPKARPKIELNINHELIKKLKSANEEKVKMSANILFDSALVANDEKLGQSQDFKQNLQKILLEWL